MPRQNHFSTGNHLAAARTFAGLKQSELANLAGLHVNSLKRLEAMGGIAGSEHACNRIGEALKTKGIFAELQPIPSIRLIYT